MRVRFSRVIVAAFATPMLLAAPGPPAPIQATTVSNLSEQSFMTLADRHFRALAGTQDYVTASNIRWDVRSTKADPPVPLPVLYTHFSCMDANKDGRVTTAE